MANVNFTPARDGTSSASTSQGNTNSYVYQVFLNHRGPDVKKGLATHIYHRLKDLGLSVFLDQKELQGGEELDPQIEGAIRTASVHVAIFSPNYALSRYCLDELVLMREQMLKSGSTIIPVFYKVEPADLRWTRGGDRVYARHLGELERQRTFDGQPRYDPKTIENWRNALSAVAGIIGFELKDKEESQLVQEVVQQVVKKARKPPLDVAKYPTGLDKKIKDVDRKLSLQRQSKKATILGIVGFGGVGKTTLAKKFFNRERSNYSRSCFLFDVRSGYLPSLQSSLLKELIKFDAQINSVAEGTGMLKERLKTDSRRSLIILDDIDHIDQLDALYAPVKDSIDVGSLILITSRNKDVLRSSGIDESSIYTLKGLNVEQSQSQEDTPRLSGEPVGPPKSSVELVLQSADTPRLSGEPVGLQSLRLNWCSSLQTLPESIGNLSGLQTLRLEGCSSLQTLPDSVANLSGLQSLHLEGCFSLQTLPDSVGNLSGLQNLNLSRCRDLKMLPDSVGKLSGLQGLYLTGCSSLPTLPDSVGNLLKQLSQRELELKCQREQERELECQREQERELELELECQREQERELERELELELSERQEEPASEELELCMMRLAV